MRTRIPNNEKGGQTTSTSFNIRDNKKKKNVWSWKQNLNAFKLIQHRSCSTSIQQTFESGEQTVEHRCQQNRTDIEAVSPDLLAFGLLRTRHHNIYKLTSKISEVFITQMIRNTAFKFLEIEHLIFTVLFSSLTDRKTVASCKCAKNVNKDSLLNGKLHCAVTLHRCLTNTRSGYN